MNENPTASDWAGERGEKWLSQLGSMEGMLAGVDEPLLEALALGAPYRIADIGCGGGATTLAILRQAPEGSIVHGYDVSPVLVESARRRAGSEKRVAFELADVGTAAAPSAPYDRLASRFGIMFFEDQQRAFDNLSKWLAPGGRFAFAAWGPPEENPWMSVVRKIVSETIEFPRPDPDAPGPFRYGDAEKLLSVLKAAGFHSVEVRDWRGQIPLGGGLNAQDAATFSLTSFSAVAELIAAAGEGASERIHRSLTARFAQHEQNGKVLMDACVHIFTGSMS